MTRDWPGPGYRLVAEGSALLVCRRCGAVVTYGSVDDHDSWHAAHLEAYA